jgi:hypothetical protein
MEAFAWQFKTLKKKRKAKMSANLWKNRNKIILTILKNSFLLNGLIFLNRIFEEQFSKSQKNEQLIR